MKNSKKIIIGLVAALVLASCGSSSSSQPADVSSVGTASFNDADVMFAQMMIPHHEQAIEMSDIALDPTIGAGETVRNLATQIKGAQDPEIQQMKDFLTSWNKSVSMDSSMDHSDMMSGMLTQEELTQLGTLRGAEFDKRWIEGMIAHHEGAIEMANDVLASGTNSDVKQLANKIIAAQNAEIEEMRALLAAG